MNSLTFLQVMRAKVFEVLASFLILTLSKIPGQVCKSNISRLLRITRMSVKVAQVGTGEEAGGGCFGGGGHGTGYQA